MARSPAPSSATATKMPSSGEKTTEYHSMEGTGAGKGVHTEEEEEESGSPTSLRTSWVWLRNPAGWQAHDSGTQAPKSTVVFQEPAPGAQTPPAEDDHARDACKGRKKTEGREFQA